MLGEKSQQFHVHMYIMLIIVYYLHVIICGRCTILA